MIIEWIERQRMKSPFERRMISLAVALCITAIIAGLYSARFTFSKDSNTQASATFEKTSPFSTLVNTISSSIESFRDQK